MVSYGWKCGLDAHGQSADGGSDGGGDEHLWMKNDGRPLTSLPTGGGGMLKRMGLGRGDGNVPNPCMGLYLPQSKPNNKS